MQIEETLHISEKQYRTAINSLIDPVHVVDLDLKIVLFNDAFKRWNQKLGLDTVGIGKTIFELFPFLPKTIREQYEQVFKTGTILITKEKIGINNKEYSTETEKIPIFDDDHVTQVITVIHDITAHKNIEKALGESEERYRRLTETAFEGIAIHEHGTILEANQSLAHMFGYELPEVIGKSALDLAAPEYRELLAKRINTGVEKTDEGMGLRKDGSTFWVELVGKNTIYQGRPARVAVLRDITERKQAEESLRRSEERYRLLVDNLAGGFALVQEGKHIYVNPAFCNIFGYTREELIGSVPEQLIAPEHKEQLRTRLQLRESGDKTTVHYEITGLRKDGQNVELEVFGSLVYYENKPTIQVTVRNITVRKQAEEKIRQLNKQLERRIMELVVTNKSLEEYDYTISHDLRGPLQAMKGATYILSEHYAAQFDATGKDSIKLLEKNLLKMEQLINNLLNYSRFGRQTTVMTPINLTLLVKDLIAELTASIPESRAQWVIEPLPTIYGDQLMLREAIFNLLHNALKYTRSNPKPKIEIGSTIESDQVIIHIKDNGIGFKMEDCDKLFMIFQRLHWASEFEGTGVGLAIVQRVIQRHNGKCWAVGKPNRGATFYFTLPKSEPSD